MSAIEIKDKVWVWRGDWAPTTPDVEDAVEAWIGEWGLQIVKRAYDAANRIAQPLMHVTK